MEKYREKIKEKGVKIIWIAEQIGISQPRLSMYLTGTREMPKFIEDKLKKILY